MSMMITLMPRFARSVATCFPIPLQPPVKRTDSLGQSHLSVCQLLRTFCESVRLKSLRMRSATRTASPLRRRGELSAPCAQSGRFSTTRCRGAVIASIFAMLVCARLVCRKGRFFGVVSRQLYVRAVLRNLAHLEPRYSVLRPHETCWIYQIVAVSVSRRCGDSPPTACCQKGL
jgi:hypothetical protein